MDSPGRILIVEDDAGTRKSLSMILKNKGYQVTSAVTGEEAISAAKESCFDLGILDIRLPDRLGTELIHPLKEIQPDIILIMATAYASMETAVQALNQGAAAYIYKPYNMDLVLATLREFLEKKLLAEAKKQAEQARNESEERYRSLFEYSLSAFALHEMITDDKGNLIDFKYLKTNRAFDRETGLEADELIGKKVSEIFVPSEAAYLIEVFGQVARTGEPIHYEYYSKERDRYFDVSIFSHKKGQCATTFFDISDKKKNEKALKRQLEELNILQAISSISIEVLDEYELIEKITKLLAEKIYSDHIGVLLLDHKKGELYLHPSYRGVSDEDLKLRIKLGQGITGQVAASGKPLRIDDAKERRDYLPNSNPSLRSEVCVPIRNKERIIGVINAEAVKVGAFSEQDERLLSTIADLLATSIERVRWFQAERRQKLEAEAQREATTALVGVFEPDQVLERIVSSLEKVVQFSCAKIFLKEGDLLKIASDTELLPDKLEEPVIPTSDALYQSIIKNKKPVIIPDARDIPDVMPWNLDIRLRSLLVAPLIDREEIIGLMVLGNVQSDYYQIEDVERVIAFVNQAASAIVKSRLFTETRKRLKNLQTLHNIDQLITASVDIRMTLDILLEQVVSSLGVDAAAILLYRSNTQMLEYVAGKGIEVHRRKKMHQKLGEGPAGKAALEREIVLRFSTENPIEHPINLSRTNQLFHFYSAVPLYAKGQIKGVLEIFNQTAFDPDNEWMDFLNALATQAALAIDNQELFNDLQRTNNNLMLAYDLTLEGWARALELRDQETEGHSQRVVKLTVELGRALHLSEKELINIRRGAYLHDIGKMGIPDKILQKPGELTSNEWEIMRQHPVYAYNLLSGIPFLKPAMDIPYCHHEKWDGTGYPQGLKGKQIPEAARIFAIVDVYDALRSDRPYRNAWPDEKIIDYLLTQSGKHFDPDIVHVFLQLIDNKTNLPT